MKQYFHCSSCHLDIYEVNPPLTPGEKITADRFTPLHKEWPQPVDGEIAMCPNCGEKWGGGIVDPSMCWEYEEPIYDNN